MSFNGVPTEITDKNLLTFKQSYMEPVPYKSILAHFCNSESNRDVMKSKLNKALVTSINSGSVVHCNNFFFARSHADDMEGVIDLSQVDEASSTSIISFSSCESVPPPVIEVQSKIFPDEVPKRTPDIRDPKKASPTPVPTPVPAPMKRQQKKKSNAK